MARLRARTLDVVAPHVVDLSDLYHLLVERGELHGFAPIERFYEIGTSASLAET